MAVNRTMLSLDLGKFNWLMLAIRRHIPSNEESVHIDVSNAHRVTGKHGHNLDMSS